MIKANKYAEIDERLKDPAFVDALLLRLFPHHNDPPTEANARDRESARLWVAVIELRFIKGLSYRDVYNTLLAAEEKKQNDYYGSLDLNDPADFEILEMRGQPGDPDAPVTHYYTADRIARVIHSIRKAALGERTDGKPRTGRAVGRPHKAPEDRAEVKPKAPKPKPQNEVPLPEIIAGRRGFWGKRWVAVNNRKKT